mmetsp:Transcript_29484/g.77973  ORF Transcript_29484/g.77973 Transcript_29484/m.77973 type:complete len:84 (-) Transcript_29484:394-645(-)
MTLMMIWFLETTTFQSEIHALVMLRHMQLRIAGGTIHVTVQIHGAPELEDGEDQFAMFSVVCWPTGDQRLAAVMFTARCQRQR